jgi:hypothetical protein
LNKLEIFRLTVRQIKILDRPPIAATFVAENNLGSSWLWNDFSRSEGSAAGKTGGSCSSHSELSTQLPSFPTDGKRGIQLHTPTGINKRLNSDLQRENRQT